MLFSQESIKSSYANKIKRFKCATYLSEIFKDKKISIVVHV